MFVGRMLPLIFAGREKPAVIEERLQHRPPDREPQIVPLAGLGLDQEVLERLGLAVDHLIDADQVLLWAEPTHILVPIVLGPENYAAPLALSVCDCLHANRQIQVRPCGLLVVPLLTTLARL